MEISTEQLELLANKILSCNNPDNFRYESKGAVDKNFEYFNYILYVDSNNSSIRIDRLDYGAGVKVIIVPQGGFPHEAKLMFHKDIFAIVPIRKLYDKDYKIINKIYNHVKKIAIDKIKQKDSYKVQEMAKVIDRAFPDLLEKDLLK